MLKQHYYALSVTWSGNTGDGTKTYRSYDRNHVVSIHGKPPLYCSADAAFRGDTTKYTPEELLVASLAGCHMLWFLHLCSESGVVVNGYADNATGSMVETPNGGGYFTEVTLHPNVTVAEESMVRKANELHKKANELCFIARSVNFPVRHQPSRGIQSPADLENGKELK
jgi:organic hydroperoxide reductase OsmC/OhrA